MARAVNTSAPVKNPHRLTWSVFVVLLLFAVFFVTGTAAELPPLVASHFDAAGQPNEIVADGDGVHGSLARIGRKPPASAASVEFGVLRGPGCFPRRNGGLDRRPHDRFPPAGRIITPRSLEPTCAKRP
jgi:hypothetical protein